ncbi:conserved protein, unknown function [Hepatocystis sp. ex Piliocolobus tephrosceles]|nr:conserved protein, unknown function [Hepatocystis sp. ex Piliocolobus tephrosceles]
MYRQVLALRPSTYFLKKTGSAKKNFTYIQERLICNQHTPLHLYNATEFSKKSMNHRIFYINWIFVFCFLDFCNSHLDI